MTIEIIFAEFGKVEVDTDHFRQYFPEATLTLITDKKYKGAGFDKQFNVYPTFPKDDIRYGYHMNDYWQVAAMLRSEADLCLAFDADVRIVSEEIRTIIPLALKFGLVLPANSRMVVKRDATFGIDGGNVDDESHGNGFALNCAITALNRSNVAARHCAWYFTQLMEKEPLRGPLVWWKAIWETGFNPYLLPFNWCVCNNDIGIGDEIMLHIGHTSVKNHYKI